MTAEAYSADQTGKREWRARVWWEGKWHALGCRDNQADAVKAARRTWHSLRGDWSGGTDTNMREHFCGGSRKTEGLPKVASGGLENKGLSADKIETRYPSMARRRVRAQAAGGAVFVCEHCGAEMFRLRGRFCSDRCRKAASRAAT